jgi:hypothetical protein
MPSIRARDLRALAFCLVTITAVLLLADRIFENRLATGAATAAYAVWILTRGRMIRVFRRLAGQRLERSSYYRN